MTDRKDRDLRGDWGELASQWKEPEPRSDAIRKRHRELSARIRRRAARRRWLTAAELLVGLGMVVWAATYALQHPDPIGWSMFLYIVLAVAGSLVFSLWNRPDSVRRDLASPADAVGAARRELVVRNRAMRFGWILLVAHAIFFVGWFRYARSDMSLGGFVFLVAWLGLFAAILALIDRRGRREARELARLADEMDDEGGDRL